MAAEFMSAEYIGTAIAGTIYVLYNEIYSKRKARKTNAEQSEGLRVEVRALKEKLDSESKRHVRDVEVVIESMRHKNDLVLMQKELYEEERKVSAEEAANEMRAAVRGSFRVLRSDIISRFSDDLTQSVLHWKCEAGVEKCPTLPKLHDANLLAYKGALERAGDKAESMAEDFILLNGYYGLGVSDLEQYLVSKNREIHRTWWDGMKEEGRTLTLIEGIRQDRVQEDYILTHWRTLVSTCIRIKTQEKTRVSEAKRRFEGAVARIYGDRREVREGD